MAEAALSVASLQPTGKIKREIFLDGIRAGVTIIEYSLNLGSAMARPLSQEKRKAILRAALEVVAGEGLGAPTAKIAKKAGVAEGTIFTYFADKDALLNALYVDLKTDLARAMGKRFPAGARARERGRHLWSCYIRWGAADPLKHQALRQLSVSERVTEASREAGRKCLGQFSQVLEEVSRDGGQSDFSGAVMNALADTTLDFIAREPGRARHYTRMGFEAFWRAAGGE